DLARVVCVVERDPGDLPQGSPALESRKRASETGRGKAGDDLAQRPVLRIEKLALDAPRFLRRRRKLQPVRAADRERIAGRSGQAITDAALPVGRVDRELPDVVPAGRWTPVRLAGRDAAQRPAQVRPVPRRLVIRLVDGVEEGRDCRLPCCRPHAAFSFRAGTDGREPPYRMMRATEPTIATVARTIRSVIASPAKAQPSSTATTGVTYAYVETRAGVVERSSQTYAEKPRREPKTMRYASERSDREEIEARSRRDPSPPASPTIQSSVPPPIICIAVEVRTELGSFA